MKPLFLCPLLCALFCCGCEPVKVTQQEFVNGRFVLTAGQYRDIEGDLVPVILKIDSQTGETWEMVDTNTKYGNVTARVWIAHPDLHEVLSPARK